ncbi:MAG: lamin tail domain-containing protein [Anaerolineae bacterium]
MDLVLKRLLLTLLATTLIVLGCTSDPTATPTVGPSPTPDPPTAEPTPTETPQVFAASSGKPLFSEFIPGVPGNNNHEFIELYNAGTEVVDLKGWSIWYKMDDDQEAKRIHFWGSSTDLPGYGHYLLVRAGEDVGAIPDATHNVPIFERRGGLQLRGPDGNAVDTLGWGEDAPLSFIEDVPAPVPAEGASLERKPGGEEGNSWDTDDGAEDFHLRDDPWPQNSGAPTTPLSARRLTIEATAPATVAPGTGFTVDVTVENVTGEDQASLQVVFPLPEGVVLEALALPEGQEMPAETAAIPDHAVAWIVPSLADGEVHRAELTLQSPWRYGDLYLRGYYVSSPDFALRDYGPFVPVAIAGGAIPIAQARALQGEVVTIEGIATMYTGGFFAGSTGTKFYLEDETGGVQVYCPDGQGVVRVDIGDRVRVTGEIEIYRDSTEIIPVSYSDHVEILAEEAASPEPATVSAFVATHDEAVLGRLIAVEGTATRLEEFTYSFELDLLDEQGDTVLVYLEKDTGVVPDFVEVGAPYRVTGISEIYDRKWQLKPRLARDFERIYPPELMLDMKAQNSVGPGGLVTYTLTAVNHTPETLTGVDISAMPAYRHVNVVEMSEGSRMGAAGAIRWTIPELAPDGGTAVVTYVVQVRPGITRGSFQAYASVTAENWHSGVGVEPWLTFVGTGVPVWAIQGEGARSPYVGTPVTTEGVVSGVFPDMGGFWIQSQDPDDDSKTSEGLFVEMGDAAVAVAVGDLVQVSGIVRERSGQTLLEVKEAVHIEVVEGDGSAPDAIELDPPRDEAEARAYYEALEGMLVRVSEPALAVGPTNQYGETPLVRTSWEIDRVRKGEPKGMLIFADDGSSVSYTDRATMPYAVKTGDMVGGLLGPLAFTYENFKIQPIITPTVVTEAITLPSLAPVGDDKLSIATFNTENFFDIFNPHPSDPERPSLETYEVKLTKVARTITAMGAPTILGLQEVENIGILEDLVAEESIRDYGYVPALLEGFDSRGIDVGYLVRGDRATVVGVSQHDAPEGLTSRPPLMMTVMVHLESGDQTVYLINNHFTSMSGGELATEPRRVAQAAWNALLAEELLSEDPSAYVVVMGDLNSFYDSPPVDVLREVGLRHVYDQVALPHPYTYVYQGESETLDHILVSSELYDNLTSVEALHLNADFPPPMPGDPSPQRSSDHDPLVAVFTFP